MNAYRIPFPILVKIRLGPKGNKEQGNILANFVPLRMVNSIKVVTRAQVVLSHHLIGEYHGCD